MVDGARTALGGYLYQFMGAAGLSARVLGERSGSVVHEQNDMDAIIRLSDGISATGVQFKYSQKSPPEPIEGSELIEIIDGFYRSTSGTTTYSFTEYKLITNRSFARSATLLYGSRGKTPDPALRPRAKIVKSGAYKKAMTLYNDETNATNSRHAILEKLDIELDVSQDDWAEKVRVFARRYGVLNSEFDSALDALVGRIFFRTIRKPLELTKELLAECLLGVSDARHLELNSDDDSAHLVAQTNIALSISRTFGQDQKFLVEREELQRNLVEQVAQHSLVFVVGNGGSGKSMLAAQFVRSELSRRFGAFVTASELEDDWLSETFRLWRSPAHSRNLQIEPFARIVDRMKYANPSVQPPVLLLDLDGVDEVEIQYRHAAIRIINRFWKMGQSGSHEAVLLVTCRSQGHNHKEAVESLVGELLDSEVGGKLVETVGTVFVGDFDPDDDLVKAAATLGTDYENRFRPDAIELGHYTEVGTETLGGGSFSSTKHRPISRAMKGSLCHPAMWGSLIGLSPDLRHPALDGDSVALSALAEEFINRFCLKANRRRSILTRDRVINALRAICAASGSRPSKFDRERDWIKPALGTMIEGEAGYLFDEAISYGLIFEEARGKWLWRHDFIRGRF